jgi:hypothetical protein
MNYDVIIYKYVVHSEVQCCSFKIIILVTESIISITIHMVPPSITL